MAGMLFGASVPLLIRSFVRYQVVNPSVYLRFREECLGLVARKKTRISAHDVLCYTRWKKEYDVLGDFEFKINTAYAAGFSRLFVHEFPEHEEKFHFKGSSFGSVDLWDMVEEAKSAAQNS